MTWHFINGCFLPWLHEKFWYLESVTENHLKGKKKGMKFGIGKINWEFHKQWSHSSQVMCAFAVVISFTRTAAAPFTHPRPLCACGFLGSLPTLTCQPSFPARVCSSWVLPAPLWMQPVLHVSLLYPGSSMNLAKCHCPWNLSPSFKCRWNWQVCSKVIKGGMTDSLTRYLISLGNQAKKKRGIVM